MNIVPFLIRLFVVMSVLAVGVAISMKIAHSEFAPQKSELVYPRVEVLKTAPQAAVRPYSYLAEVVSEDAVWISSRVEGIVTAAADTLENGRQVAKGELLIEIECDRYQTQVEAAQHAVKNAEAAVLVLTQEQTRLENLLPIRQQQTDVALQEYEDAKHLQDQGVATATDVRRSESALLNMQALLLEHQEGLSQMPSRLQQANAQLSQMQAQLAQAELLVRDCQVFAPVDGVVTQEALSVGQMVAPGQKLFRIVPQNNYTMMIDLPASALQHCEVGTELLLDNQTVVITRVSPEIDKTRRVWRVYAQVPVDAGYLPGQQFSGQLLVSLPNQIYMLPRRSVMDGAVASLEATEVQSDAVYTTQHISVTTLWDLWLPSTMSADYPDLGWVAVSFDGEAPNYVLLDASEGLVPGLEMQAEAYDVPVLYSVAEVLP